MTEAGKRKQRVFKYAYLYSIHNGTQIPYNWLIKKTSKYFHGFKANVEESSESKLNTSLISIFFFRFEKKRLSNALLASVVYFADPF